MEIESVHESQPYGQEHRFPDYRVCFYERRGPGASVATAYCYDIRAVHNVHQVFAWAEASARGRTYIVYACTPHYLRGEIVRLQLSGDDPNMPDDERRVPPPELADPVESEMAEQADFEHKYRPR